MCRLLERYLCRLKLSEERISVQQQLDDEYSNEWKM